MVPTAPAISALRATTSTRSGAKTLPPRIGRDGELPAGVAGLVRGERSRCGYLEGQPVIGVDVESIEQSVLHFGAVEVVQHREVKVLGRPRLKAQPHFEGEAALEHPAVVADSRTRIR